MGVRGSDPLLMTSSSCRDATPRGNATFGKMGRAGQEFSSNVSHTLRTAVGSNTKRALYHTGGGGGCSREADGEGTLLIVGFLLYFLGGQEVDTHI